MTAARAFDVLGAIIGVALVTTLVRSPNTAKVIGASGNALTGLVRASMGR